MSSAAIVIFLISVALVIGSAIPNMERCMPLAQYILLTAILVEVGCIHELWKERKP